MQRVKTEDEEEKVRIERQERERKLQETREKEQEKTVKELRQSRELEQLHLETINKNPLYEYHVELIPDLSNGVPDYQKISKVLICMQKRDGNCILW